MSRHSAPTDESRLARRYALPPMYTLIRVRRADDDRYRWTGHIYDISSTGVRFELDSPIAPGAEVTFRAMLPGSEHTTITATGRVIRLHDDAEERGPMRMGLAITSFAHHSDRHRLDDYLSRLGAQAQRRAA